MTLEYHPLFGTDLLEAARYLANEDSLLGFKFIKEVEEAVVEIKKHPLLFPTVYKEIRRKRLKRFKAYSIRFRYNEQKQLVRVLSLTHGARHPKTGTGRR